MCFVIIWIKISIWAKLTFIIIVIMSSKMEFQFFHWVETWLTWNHSTFIGKLLFRSDFMHFVMSIAIGLKSGSSKVPNSSNVPSSSSYMLWTHLWIAYVKTVFCSARKISPLMNIFHVCLQFRIILRYFCRKVTSSFWAKNLVVRENSSPINFGWIQRFCVLFSQSKFFYSFQERFW